MSTLGLRIVSLRSLNMRNALWLSSKKMNDSVRGWKICKLSRRSGSSRVALE